MIDHTTEQKGDVKVLQLRGDLTVQHACELRSILLASLEEAECIELDLSSIREVDTSCLQLFCAANRTSRGMKKLLTVRNNPSEAARQAIRRAGYPCSSLCIRDRENQCIWDEERLHE